MFIHLVLGFGINEIFIMAPHFMFVLPIATAYLLQKLGGLPATMVRVSVLMLTLWLFTYNGYLLIDFLLSPIRATL